jgi:hypothetical protein
MKAAEKRGGLPLRCLPVSARQVASRTAGRSTTVARSQFSRTFADVLSGRFGGNWSVEWKRSRSRSGGS